jgi:hypothetical protein
MALGPYFDPLGETEPHTTLYTLTVYIPARPPPSWLPGIFTRPAAPRPSTGLQHKIPQEDGNPNLDCFESKHLDDMRTKKITIQSAWFPPEMRCEHVQDEKECDKGCYFLEKGGKVSRWRCKTAGCEGHVYCGPVEKDLMGQACFGEKAKRMVCLRR